MDGQTISDLVYGLEIGMELKLPVNSCFRAEQMSQLLASTEIVRPFCQLRLVGIHVDGVKEVRWNQRPRVVLCSISVYTNTTSM